MSEQARDYPDFRKGKRSTLKLRGGPMAGIPTGFLETDTELCIETKDGVYVGRYVRRAIQQKNRVIQSFQWEGDVPTTWATIREQLALGGPL